MAKVSAAKPALWRATFTHKDHLTKGEACASCHVGGEGGSQPVAKSAQSSDLWFKGVKSCRECHRRGQASEACQHCHDYHPRAAP